MSWASGLGPVMTCDRAEGRRGRSKCVRVDSDGELLDVVRAAEEAGVMAHLCVDAGRTEFHGVPTPTCCAVGPDFPARIDPITGHLKLL